MVDYGRCWCKNFSVSLRNMGSLNPVTLGHEQRQSRWKDNMDHFTLRARSSKASRPALGLKMTNDK